MKKLYFPSQFVAVDFETTGFGRRSEIIEFGLVFVDRGEIVKEVEALVFPSGFVPQEIFDFTGIERAKLAAASPMRAHIDWLFKALDGKALVAHSSHFEKRFVAQTFKAHGLQVPDCRYVCTCQAAKKLVPHLPDHKLGTVAEHFDIQIERTHRALDDARACGLVQLELERIYKERTQQ